MRATAEDGSWLERKMAVKAKVSQFSVDPLYESNIPLLVLSNFRVGLVIVRLSNESKTSDSASWKKCLVDISKEKVM
jgi:hypothetical protein